MHWRFGQAHEMTRQKQSLFVILVLQFKAIGQTEIPACLTRVLRNLQQVLVFAHHDAHHAHLIDLRLPQCVSDGLHALKLQRTLWRLKHLLLRPKKTQVGVDQTRAAPQHQHHACHPRQSTVPTHGLGLPAGRSRRDVGDRGHFMLQVKPTM